MNFLQELEFKKQQKLEERKRKAREYYRRIRGPKQARIKVNDIWMRENDYLLAIDDCISKGIPFVPPGPTRQKRTSRKTKKQTDQKECCNPLLQCQTPPGNVLEPKNCEDPTKTTDSINSCIEQQRENLPQGKNEEAKKEDNFIIVIPEGKIILPVAYIVSQLNSQTPILIGLIAYVL